MASKCTIELLIAISARLTMVRLTTEQRIIVLENRVNILEY